jgi:hypothetical protein
VCKEGAGESANVGVVVDEENGCMGFGIFQVRALFFCLNARLNRSYI